MANSFRFRNPSARGYSVVSANDVVDTVTFTLPAATSEITVSDSANGITQIAIGNTAQRPIGLTTEAIRFNTTTNTLEVYSTASQTWSSI